MTTILGLNAFHGDSAACLVRDGEIVAAAEEERFRRIKHWAGFPARGDPLLPRGRRASALARRRARRGQPGRRARTSARRSRIMLTQRPDLRLVLDRMRNKRERAGRRSASRARVSRSSSSAARCTRSSITSRTLSSAFHVSPFDEAVVVSVDGFGDFASAAWGVGRGTAIDVEGRVYFPHSLGHLLSGADAVPRLSALRRRVQGDGPRALRRADVSRRRCARSCGCEDDGSFELDLDYFRHHREKIDYEWDGRLARSSARSFPPALEELLGPARGAGRAARAAAQRHRALGAGDVRGGVLPSAERAARAPSARRRRASPAAAA